MLKLRLISLFCITTEDNSGADEPYLVVGGNKIWSGSLNDGDSADLNQLPLVEFSQQIEVKLYDKDQGWLIDPDDHLGTIHISSSLLNQGNQKGVFANNGANYELIYSVIN